VNCDRAQAAISERMDGERLPGRVTTAVDAHVEGCANCRTFAERASRVRTTVRIRPAERIPDLVDPIMAEVARSSPAGRPLRRHRSVRRAWIVAPTAAALAVGLVAGSLVVGGPWRDHPENISALEPGEPSSTMIHLSSRQNSSHGEPRYPETPTQPAGGARRAHS